MSSGDRYDFEQFKKDLEKNKIDLPEVHCLALTIQEF